MTSAVPDNATTIAPHDTPTSTKLPDWSLRPNGETYRDRSSESQRITRRLQNSTGSVTGISGQRGAGKSSLAHRVLANCNAKGAFTLLIHSPTDYDSKEFLVSVFQRVCEAVVARIDRDLGKPDSLSERGDAERRRLRNIRYTVLAGAILLLFGSTAFTSLLYSQEVTEQRRAEIENRISFLNQQEANLIGRTPEAPQNQSDGRDEMQFRYRFLDEIAEERRYLQRLLYDTPERLLSSFVIFAPITLFIYGAAILLVRYLFRIQRQLRQARKHPREVGLRTLALDHIENLKFHTTLVESGETGISLANITSRFRSGKNLATRPLSLPGLTAEFADFLEMTASIYTVDEKMGQVVICLDELDKIENPRDLDKLLRGIKGVLGRPGTHFLLTVSEDALAAFATRRRMSKGIVESALEEIVLLERVDLSVATHIIDLMCPQLIREEDSRTQHKFAALFWFFGAGVPREIKRCVLLFLDSELVARRVTPIEVWRLLFTNRLTDIRSWVLRFGADDEATYGFLPQLQESIDFFQSEVVSGSTENWCIRDFILLWIGHYNNLCARGILRNGNADNKSGNMRLAYGRAIVELILGASARAYAESESCRVFDDIEIERLSVIFEFMPTNIAFAMGRTNEYLESIGLKLQNQ